MEQNINIYPVLVTWKENKTTKKCPISAAIDLDNKRITLVSLKRKVTREEWDEANKKVKDEVVNSKLINAAIRRYIDDADAMFLRKQLLGVTLNKEMIKKLIKNQDTGADFYAFCREQINIKKYADETRRTYRTEVTKMEKFRPALTFRDVDFSFLQNYSAYMREVLENEHNTVWKSLKFISTMMSDAIKIGGLIEKNPFKDFDRGKYEQGIPDYLEWPEVQKLHHTIRTHISLTPELRLIGYYALLPYYSGLRFSDTAGFNYTKYVSQTENGERLVLRTEKSGGIVSIAFTDEIKEVVSYIKERPLFQITNQDFNKQLKIIGGLAQISTPLHTHMGRHSFAMRCADLGMSEESVQRLLGHKDRKSTKIYFRIKDKRLDNEMKVWKIQPVPDKQEALVG